MRTRVLIVDDHSAAREGLAVRITSQPDLEVCAQAADAAEAMKLVETSHPDVVVVDIQLEVGSGFDLVEWIKLHHGSIGILVWSMYSDTIYAERALRAGALGYINKQQATSRIVEAIRRVRDGKIFLCEETAERLLGQAVGSGKQGKGLGVEVLSQRELQVFRLIGEGLTTSQIARRLRRSVNTVGAHREKIKRKLGLKGAGELTRAAMQWRLENG